MKKVIITVVIILLTLVVGWTVFSFISIGNIENSYKQVLEKSSLSEEDKNLVKNIVMQHLDIKKANCSMMVSWEENSKDYEVYYETTLQNIKADMKVKYNDNVKTDYIDKNKAPEFTLESLKNSELQKPETWVASKIKIEKSNGIIVIPFKHTENNIEYTGNIALEYDYNNNLKQYLLLLQHDGTSTIINVNNIELSK